MNSWNKSHLSTQRMCATDGSYFMSLYPATLKFLATLSVKGPPVSPAWVNEKKPDPIRNRNKITKLRVSNSNSFAVHYRPRFPTCKYFISCKRDKREYLMRLKTGFTILVPSITSKILQSPIDFTPDAFSLRDISKQWEKKVLPVRMIDDDAWRKLI